MRFWLCILLLLVRPALSLEIPKGLSASDRQEVVETLGLGAAPKMLTNPYPLGGFSGFEIGYSVEFINIRDVNHLGCAVGSPGCANTHVPDDDEFTFSRITIGKGLFHDVDIFFSFAPPIGGTNISDYGGSLRWAFYQAEFLPLTFSAVLNANRMNIQDEFINQNIGGEIIIGMTVDNFAVYIGGGEVFAQGTFLMTDTANGTVSPPNPPNPISTNTVVENVSEIHAVVGFSAKFENLFAAAELDHYRDSVYSMKLGMRF